MYGLEDKILAILFSISILAIYGLSRTATGIFAVPAGIFAISWFAFTITPLVLLFRAPINSLAILYIAAVSLTFLLSAVPFNWRYATNKNRDKNNLKLQFDTTFLSAVTYFSVIAGVFLSFAIVVINGFSLNQFIFDLIGTSGRYAEVRAKDGLEYGILGILGIFFTYLPPVLGGLRSLGERGRFFFALTMAPSLISMVIQSQKLVFLVSLCFYISGAIVARIYSHKLDFPKPEGIKNIMAASVLISALLLISFISRLGEFDPEAIVAIADPLFFSIASYTLGEIYGFADFFSFSIGASSLSSYQDDYASFGAYTFNSIFSMLGVGKEFPVGMYEESVWFSNIFETNIFTFFRGLIYDFGIVGSLIFIFVFGLFAHYVTYLVFIRSRSWLCVVTLISILVFIFMGYIHSVFVARYVFLTSAVLWLLLLINDRLHHPLKNNESNLGIKAV